MKLKPLLPSLKEKKRYLSFEIISEKNISVENASKAVNESTLKFLGTLESAKAGFMFLADKYTHNAGVVKTGHKYTEKVRTALALIPTIENEPVIFRTRIVSGTLKKAISKFHAMKAEV